MGISVEKVIGKLNFGHRRVVTPPDRGIFERDGNILWTQVRVIKRWPFTMIRNSQTAKDNK